MLQLKGTYSNGQIKLDKKVTAAIPVPVIVTFVEEVSVVEENVGGRFSFDKTRALLKELKTSFSDTVVEERRAAL